jgi:hypothetical protein
LPHLQLQKSVIQISKTVKVTAIHKLERDGRKKSVNRFLIFNNGAWYKQGHFNLITLGLTVAGLFGFDFANANGASMETRQQDDEITTPNVPKIGERMSDAQVVAFAELALKGMSQEFPNKPSNVMNGPDSVLSPKQMHPAFYGCFDWHSSVHGHWMLVRLLKLYPDCSVADEIRKKLDTHLTADNLKAEVAYFQEKHNRSFERMYGWGWLLRLAAELHQWDDQQGKVWRENIRPLENEIVSLTMEYLPKLTWPIRTGVHADSAFALGQTIDYARIVSNKELEQLVLNKAQQFYLRDTNYPAEYEPSGEDFFSPGLNEADTMRRILNREEFSKWFNDFLPDIKKSDAGNLMTPVSVSDVTDGKLVHLAGLNLSRAWTLNGIAHALGQSDPNSEILRKAAQRHAEKGFEYVFSGHYEGEHWLATFAVYTLTEVGISKD